VINRKPADFQQAFLSAKGIFENPFIVYSFYIQTKINNYEF